MIAKIKELMYEPEQIRNIGICAHIDHGKTTLSDNLLAGAGMISEELAGDQRFLDFDDKHVVLLLMQLTYPWYTITKIVNT